MSLGDSTKSYNESGVFLQAYVNQELKKLSWDVVMEHPVVVAPFRKNPKVLYHQREPVREVNPERFVQALHDSQNSFELSERSIDVVGGRMLDGERALKLCIECKKLNPKYTEWCFFDQQKSKRKLNVITKSRDNAGIVNLFHVPKTTKYGNEIFLYLHNRFGENDFVPKTFADFAIAMTNEKIHGDYYKTEKTVVDMACRQIIEGTYGLTIEVLISQILAGNSYDYGRTDIFIPIIVTNAKLKFCEFDPEKINPKTGHLTEEPKYEDIDSIIYEYNSPKTVQYPEPLFGSLKPELRKATAKWDVLIMSPHGFTEFLEGTEKLWGPVKYL